jgi:transglutaminase-like putative cysteine protease
MSWEDVAARDVSDRWTEFLVLPDLVAPPADFAQRARQVAADHERPGDAARDLCALVHDEVEPLAGPTDVRGSAATAWQQRGGVRQDVAHLVIGGLRTLGIPARYVSGYLHPDRDPVVGASVVGAAHAWVEWWDAGWHAHDPCHDTEPDDRYVSLAHGRDYADVRPISGIYSGAATSRRTVAVDVTRLA